MSLPVASPRPSPQAVAPAAADFRGPALFGHHRVQQIPPGADRPVTGAAAASRSAGLCDTWPLLQRQRLEKVDAHLLHERLIAWCRNLPPDSQQRPPLEAQLAKTPSSLALFASLTQQMRAAERLSCHQEKAGCELETQRLEGNPWSPDGTHLVLSCDTWNDEGEGCCLWRLEAERAHKAAFLPLERSFDCCAVTFSAGSQRLLAVSTYGQLQIWNRRADDSWQEAASVRLWTGTARAACFSPDGRCLAVQRGGQVLLFDEQATGLWRQQCCLHWISLAQGSDTSSSSDTSGRDTDSSESSETCSGSSSDSDGDELVRHPPDVMYFSADSRHFLFVNGVGGKAFVFDRYYTCWRAQTLHRENDVVFYNKGGILAPGGDWLALVSEDWQGGAFWKRNFIVHLWHPADRRGAGRSWHAVAQKICADARGGFPLACSPDGLQLACPDRLDNSQVCVSILARSRSGRWAVSDKLQLGPDSVGADSLSGARELAYSARGDYLAAVSLCGVQLWHLSSDRGSAVAWINNSAPGRDLLFQFSPDGCHCAVCLQSWGDVRILGPAEDGRYLEKARWMRCKSVEQMAFAPDGTRLMVTQRDSPLADTHVNFLYLAPAVWEQGGRGCHVS